MTVRENILCPDEWCVVKAESGVWSIVCLGYMQQLRQQHAAADQHAAQLFSLQHLTHIHRSLLVTISSTVQCPDNISIQIRGHIIIDSRL